MKIFLLLIVISGYQVVYAFGETGHRIVGAIAEFYLTPKAKKEIERVLGVQDLAEVSTYADEMRSNPDEFWQKTASPFHYVTVPKGKSYDEVGAPEKGDSVTALNMFKKQLLTSKSTKEEKALALKFIVHLVADLHQPLHAGNGTDRGGNDFKVKFFWEDSNLHRVWDSGLIDRKKLSYTEWTLWLNRSITKNNLKEWKSIKPQTWIAESAQIRDSIYPEQKEISYRYLFKHMPTMKLRLKQAGVRLAYYLNEIYQ